MDTTFALEAGHLGPLTILMNRTESRREADREPSNENSLRRQLVPEYGLNRNGSDDDAHFELIRQESNQRYAGFMTQRESQNEFDGFEYTDVQC